MKAITQIATTNIELTICSIRYISHNVCIVPQFVTFIK